MKHIYHSFSRNSDFELLRIEKLIEKFYTGKSPSFMEFGIPGTRNERIYTVTIFGLPEFESSIAISHVFFGKFKVTSMLTRYSEMLHRE